MNSTEKLHDFEEIQRRINEIIINQFEVSPDDISGDKQLFSDLGLDSLDAIDLIIAFQSQFKIKPPNEELKAIRTMNDVYQLVAKYAKEMPTSKNIVSKGV
jgi:acyl carrier protein